MCHHGIDRERNLLLTDCFPINLKNTYIFSIFSDESALSLFSSRGSQKDKGRTKPSSVRHLWRKPCMKKSRKEQASFSARQQTRSDLIFLVYSKHFSLSLGYAPLL